MARVRDQYADALRILFEGNQRLADDIRKRLSDMQPMLNQLQEVCEGINRYEADAIGALEDDFYADRGDA